MGEEAPDFTAETSEETLIRFHEWEGESWALLFSHPGDLTPVCTSELRAAAALKPEFDERNTRLITLSVDPLIIHYRWLNDIERITGAAMDFPIIADPNRYVAMLHGRLHPKPDSYRTVRTTVVVDPSNRVEFLSAHPPGTGRDFREILRVIDSLQRTWKHGVATPAGRHPNFLSADPGSGGLKARKRSCGITSQRERSRKRSSRGVSGSSGNRTPREAESLVDPRSAKPAGSPPATSRPE